MLLGHCLVVILVVFSHVNGILDCLTLMKAGTLITIEARLLYSTSLMGPGTEVGVYDENHVRDLVNFNLKRFCDLLSAPSYLCSCF